MPSGGGWHPTPDQLRAAYAQAKVGCDGVENPSPAFRAGADECFAKGGISASLCAKGGGGNCCRVTATAADISGRRFVTLTNPQLKDHTYDVFEIKGTSVEQMCKDLTSSKVFLCTGEDG